MENGIARDKCVQSMRAGQHYVVCPKKYFANMATYILLEMEVRLG